MPEAVGATIVWFQQDLRLEDNTSLTAAAERGGPVVPVFVWSPEEEGDWSPGSASRWWLHHSLAALDSDLKHRGSRLILRRGPAEKELLSVARKVGADRVFWNRRHEPAAAAREERAAAALSKAGMECRRWNDALLFEPEAILTRTGGPYKVFTPFWKSCTANLEATPPLSAPLEVRSPQHWPASVSLDDLELLPRIGWADGIRNSWTPGSRGASTRLKRFLEIGLTGYAEQRDFPDEAGTSALSPHLHFGEISPRTIWHEVLAAVQPTSRNRAPKSAEPFLRQLGWREFAHHLLHHFPHTPDRALREEFRRFPWSHDEVNLRRWERGRTGYPIVDAGMRQLWSQGWMHNRVRMVAASFLTKHLRIHWLAGARWFWDTLVDADLANNTLGWQWTAGCGADAAPYFRIFNPITQGKRFDPRGSYVRRWIPELAKLPDRWIHEPWKAPPLVLKDAGLALGCDYPEPIVEHHEARRKALEAFEHIKR